MGHSAIAMVLRTKFKDAWEKFLFPFLALLVLTFLGCILDITYQGKIKCQFLVGVLNLVKQFLKSCGLSHSEIWDFITSNTGVMITLVTIFFTFTIEIFERSEKKIFGIPLKELIDIRAEYWYRELHIMVVMLPFFMLAYIVLGFCAGSYLLLFWGYVFLILIYGKHRSFYDEEKMVGKVCQKLSGSFREAVCVKDVKDWDGFKNTLIGIYDSAKKESDWIHIQKLFFEFAKVLQKLEDEICFVAAYYFAFIVFGQENKTHEFDSFKVVRKYMESIEYDDNSDYKNRKDTILLWGLLSASIPYAEEKELLEFLRFFTDFTNRSCHKIRHMGQEVPNSICERESAMVLILLEEWLKKESTVKDEMQLLAGKVYKMGEAVFEEESPWNQEEWIFLCESIPGYYKNIRENVNEFRKEKHYKMAITRTACLAEACEA